MKRRLARILCVLLLVLFSSASIPAQEYRFSLDRNVSHLYINTDGSADIEYELHFTCDLGAHPIDVVDVGMPNKYYDLKTARAEVNGATLDTIKKSTVLKCGVEIHLKEHTIPPGKSGTVRLLIRDKRMVFRDRDLADYASVEFWPHYYDKRNVHGECFLSCSIHFPEGVGPHETKYHRTRFDKAEKLANRIVFTWEEPNAAPWQSYRFGVSFPAKYVNKIYRDIKSGPGTGPAVLSRVLRFVLRYPQLIFGIVFAVVVVLRALTQQRRKMQYLPPRIGVEGVGIKKGLTPVEVAVLMERPLDKVLTMILFGLIKKNYLRVVQEVPLMLQRLPRGTEGLLDYEKDFLEQIEPGSVGGLEEKDLRRLTVDLVKGLNKKMRGFSRKETIRFYGNQVNEMWQELSEQRTPEVVTETFSRNSDWLMTDEDYDRKSGEIFEDKQAVARPGWWYYVRPSTTRTQRPDILPGSSFGHQFGKAFRSLSDGLVKNVRSFTSHVTNVTNPIPRGGGGGGGGFSCACACACAGCACACAGGGR